MILTWRNAFTVVSAKRHALLMPLLKDQTLNLQQKLMRLVHFFVVISIVYVPSVETISFCVLWWYVHYRNMFPFSLYFPQIWCSISELTCIKLFAGASVWQRKAAGEWWSMGNWDRRESKIRKFVSLIFDGLMRLWCLSYFWASGWKVNKFLCIWSFRDRFVVIPHVNNVKLQSCRFWYIGSHWSTGRGG